MKSAIIIVPAARHEIENQWFRDNFAVIGDAITAPLSSDGSEPATHYGTDWACITDADYTRMYNRFQNKNGCKCLNSNTWDFDQACASVGLQRVEVPL